MKVCALCHRIRTRYIVAAALLVGLGAGIFLGAGVTAFQVEIYKGTMKGIVNQAINKIGHAAAKEAKKK